MKILSIVVPSYNAEKYLDRSVPSLVVGGEDVEVIIVNDGSKDNTLQIARKYEKEFPNIVKVIDKENGGHGSGINAALEIATGLYFKCCDADDWFAKDAYLEFLDLIRKHIKEGTSPDLYLTNFVYNRLDTGKTHVHDCTTTYPTNRFMTWEDFKSPNNKDFFMMHMFTYKTEILRKSGLHLPEHTFYVDNLYVYQPLYYVKTMYYLPVGLYQYYVGHADQSISYENMAKNYKHALRVYEKVMTAYTYEDLKKLTKVHKRYMIFSIVVIEALTLFYSVVGKKQGSKKEYRLLNKQIKQQNKKLYYKASYRTRFIWSHLVPPGILRDFAVSTGYKIVKKKTGWY